MARVVLSGEVRRFTGDLDHIELDAKNVMQLFHKLGQRFPDLAPILETSFAVAVVSQRNTFPTAGRWRFTASANTVSAGVPASRSVC